MSGLVQYSGSDTDDDTDINQQGKRKLNDNGSSGTEKKQNQEKKSLLPLPDDIVLMFQDVKPSKIPKLDILQGRVRSFPHVEGDWASFVYIPARSCCGCLKVLITALIDRARKMLPGFEPIDAADLHVSLSRTVSLRHYWIEEVVAKLKKSFTCINSFKCRLDVIDLYTNDEKTRSFLGFRIIIGEEELQRISQKVDSVFDEFGLPKYYENPLFHVSFAWHLGDIRNKLPENFLEDLQELTDSFDDDCDNQKVHQDARTLINKNIFLKTGNKVYCIKS